MSAGRPSTYTDAIVEKICVELMLGESLKSICSRDDMPGEATVYAWLIRYPVFQEKYARAREIQSERGVDEIIEIADDGRNDWMAAQEGDGAMGWRENGENIRRSALRIDARKWKAGKLRPKVYGDKIQTELTGAGGGPIQTVDLAKLSDGQIEQLSTILSAASGAADAGSGEGGTEP